MDINKTIIVAIALLFAQQIAAKEVAGVKIPDNIQLGSQDLVLNGAGIRTKFVFDIYIGGLYLAQQTKDVKQAITMQGPKRVLMHFLYDEVEKEKLTDGWLDGFENNLSDKDFTSFKPRLEEFNQLFVTAKKGDEILLDYLPGKGTQVTINNQLKGSVAGEDFYRALLKVWLGDDPADDDLKEAMLGN